MPTSHQPPATSHQPPATSHQPPATSHQPPATSHQPPATSHQPPATSHQPPATSHQPATSDHHAPAAISHRRPTPSEHHTPSAIALRHTPATIALRPPSHPRPTLSGICSPFKDPRPRSSTLDPRATAQKPASPACRLQQLSDARRMKCTWNAFHRAPKPSVSPRHPKHHPTPRGVTPHHAAPPKSTRYQSSPCGNDASAN